ncbi:hypothetical protein [Erwinia persicina]|uniref:hypothetical protein n=1 Tax=Erwinia persicina TaxID=55211 RepID=UPI001784C565|nr:hypothetical protein [Erwinia persicina]MBD8165235.1 hypothetical protein [Erwinia persicina]MBD8215878.1 hypothetical protein [Erwinia persicina]
MYRNEDEEELLSDIILGEAVMVLLKADAAISSSALIRQLQAMAAGEKELTRQRACRRAIAEVRSYQAPEPDTDTREIRDRDNVTHLFTSEGPADGTKKH